MKVELENGKIIIDGEEHEMPCGRANANTVVIQTEDKLYVNGYEYCEDGKDWVTNTHSMEICGM